MTLPIRLRLSRRRGFDLQALSREMNGLEAVSVARPSKWGNIYVIGGKHPDTGEPVSREEAVRLFAEYVAPHASVVKEHLAGKNLACWCALHDAQCHADVLLELANS